MELLGVVAMHEGTTSVALSIDKQSGVDCMKIHDNLRVPTRCGGKFGLEVEISFSKLKLS